MPNSLRDFCASASNKVGYMLVSGLALLAFSIVLMWLCLPSKSGETKPFLQRGGADVLAAIIVTGCIAVGTVLTIAAIVR